MYQGMADGLSLLFTFQNQLYLITGIIAGIVLGALPGFNASTAMVVLLPFTYLLEPVESLILLSGVAGAGIYGGSITAILFRTPGTIGSIVSAIDGYELTRKGQGVRALGISTTASAIGSIFSAVALLAVAPPLAVFATKFSFAEMFVLIIWSFTIIAALGGSLLKGLAAGAFGMVLASVGADPMNAYPRMTFGIPHLFEGVNFLTAIMGYFCFSEMMRISKRDFILQDVSQYQGGYSETLKGALYTLKRPWVLVRGSIIGVLIGALPAAGAGLANILSYSVQKTIDRDSKGYGSGKPEGLIAAESANNATEGSCLIPTLTLGIPGSNIAAILLVAMTLHGIVVGPRVFNDHGTVVYALVFAILFANPFMFVFGIGLSKFLGKVTTFPIDRLLPFILVFILIGTYAVRNSDFDFYIMVLFGIMAYFMQAHGYPMMALVLPFVLGRSLEQSYIIAMKYSSNSPIIFFDSAICLTLWGLILLTLVGPALYRRRFAPKSTPSLAE